MGRRYGRAARVVLAWGSVGASEFNCCTLTPSADKRHPLVRRGTPLRVTSAPNVWLRPTCCLWPNGCALDFFCPCGAPWSSTLETTCAWPLFRSALSWRISEPSRLSSSDSLCSRRPKPAPSIRAAASAARFVSTIGAASDGAPLPGFDVLGAAAFAVVACFCVVACFWVVACFCVVEGASASFLVVAFFFVVAAASADSLFPDFFFA